MPAQDVAQMHGERGLSVVVRAVLQWRAVEPRARDWTIVATDLTAALNLLRDRPVGYDLELPLSDWLAKANAEHAAQAKEKLRARADACERRRVESETVQQASRASAAAAQERPIKRRRKVDLKDEDVE